MVYTVDASVFLNAFNRHEAGHEISHRFLARLREQAIPIVAPALLLPEVAAAVSRGRGDADLARGFASAVGRLPHLVLIPLDVALTRESASVAAQHRLRGSDAVYAAVALRFGSTLVTLDQEQWERVAGVLPVQRPAEARQG